VKRAALPLFVTLRQLPFDSSVSFPFLQLLCCSDAQRALSTFVRSSDATLLPVTHSIASIYLRDPLTDQRTSTLFAHPELRTAITSSVSSAYPNET
jgi:hypothetical protein